MTATETTGTSITIHRSFDAPVDRVWRAWSDPDELTQWSAPAGWTYEIFELDFREGGVHRYCMYGPDGEESRDGPSTRRSSSPSGSSTSTPSPRRTATRSGTSS